MSSTIRNQQSGWQACRHAAPSLAMLGAIAGAALSINAQAAVVEFFNPDLNNYFITADPTEQAFVDTGAVGRWQRTGNAFATGGPNQVCRFYGNANINPATGAFFGPNSHFYTADPAECAGLKAQYTPSAKSWNFESNDFLTTPATGGACPAGRVPVYRAYNNGFARGIDSNHRITSNLAAYLQTVAAGSIGEGIVMCAPAPTVTAVGVASGAASSATIGPAGGTVSAADGKLTLTIPPGALASPTVIGIQPLTNKAHGKIGAAYRLTPEGQAFGAPVTLAFAYADTDLAGTAVEFLGAAFQTAAGHWQWAGDPTVNATAKTVSVSSIHFSDWSQVKGVQILPASKTVRVRGSVGLQVVICFDPDPVAGSGGELAPLGYDCDAGEEAAILNVASDWSVNGVRGGSGVTGTVSGGGTTATYVAPATKPNPNTVAVSARVDRGLKGRTLVVSNIRIEEDSWTGTGSSTSSVISATAQVTWTLESTTNNIATYRPTGSASVVINGCITYDPSSGTINPNGGVLTVDYNTTPPTYHGSALTQWPTIATVTCPMPPPPFATLATAAFFGGSKGTLGVEAQGSVSPDGTTIEGTDTNNSGSEPVTFTWKFTRN
ncbi:MAG: hypothetical protein ABI831_20630 [Betaproteobacteria bacterium]